MTVKDFPTAVCNKCDYEWSYRGKFSDKPERIKCPLKECRATAPNLYFGEVPKKVEKSEVKEKILADDVIFTMDGGKPIDMLRPEDYKPPEDLKRMIDAKQEADRKVIVDTKEEAKPSGVSMTDSFTPLIQFLGARLNMMFETEDFTVDSVSANILGQAVTEEISQSGGIEQAVVSAYSRRVIIILMVALLFLIPLLVRVLPALSKMLGRKEEAMEEEAVKAIAEHEAMAKAKEDGDREPEPEPIETVGDVALEDIIQDR